MSNNSNDTPPSTTSLTSSLASQTMQTPEQERCVVTTWLTAASLSYAIPSFEMAGIVTPRSFADLDLPYFAALGVTKAEDRKRLFYLVTNVRGVLDKAEEERKLRKKLGVGDGDYDGEGNEFDLGEDYPTASGEQFYNHNDDDNKVIAATKPRGENGNGLAVSASARIRHNYHNRPSSAASYHDNDNDVMSTVETHNQQYDPISPVTLSSPIAHMEEHQHLRKEGGRNHHFDFGDSNGNGRRKSGGIMTRGNNANGNGNELSPQRKILQKELEARRARAANAKQTNHNHEQGDDEYETTYTHHPHPSTKDDTFYEEDFEDLEEEEDDDHPALATHHTDDRSKSKSSGNTRTRRQSFLPSVAGSRSSRRSSISTHRSSSRRPDVIGSSNDNDDTDEDSVTRGEETNNRSEFKEGLDEIDSLLYNNMDNNDNDDEEGEQRVEECKSRHEYKHAESDDSDDDDSYGFDGLSTHKSVVTSTSTSSKSKVDVRSMRRSSGIRGGHSIHHRATVKKANTTRSGGTAKTTTASAMAASSKERKNRRKSGIPRAKAPLLDREDDEDDDDEMSETSDLSASVSSYRSLGSSASLVKSRASLSRENYHGNTLDGKKTKKNSKVMAAKLSKDRSGRRSSIGSGIGGGSSNSSIASGSIRSRTTTTGRTAGSKKRLSTIPSSSIAPISPMAGLSSVQLDESIVGSSSVVGGGKRDPLRRRSSLGGGLTSSSSSSRRPGSASSVTSSRSRPGTVGSITRARPSSRSSLDGSQRGGTTTRLRSKKLDVSTAASSGRSVNSAGPTSPSALSAASSVSRRRVKSPVPRNNDMGVRSRSKSPVPCSRTARPKSPMRAKSPVASTRAMSPSRTYRTVSPKRAVSPKRTTRPVSPIRTRPLSPVRSRATSPRRAKSPVNNSRNNGAVFVHGHSKDNSWATQIGQLRQAFDLEHENYNCEDESDDDDQYEMRIRVIVKKRPFSKKESTDGSDIDVIHPLDYNSYGRILVHQPKTKLDLTKEVETTSFAFDNVFSEESNNVQIYEQAVQSLIPGVFRGKWASVFAYGQTGSGKTFTMMGSNATGTKAGNQADNMTNDQNLGLYYLAAQDVFKIAEEPAYADISIGVSLFEIYGGKLLDLLNARNPVRCLEDRKGKVCFPGLSEHPVSDAEELMDIIDAGALNRSTGTTSANADSSRSHAVLQLSLRKDVGRAKNKEHGRLTFIDLAGSERGADTSKACRTTRMEGAEINTSLLALKEVIRALATGSSLKRIPFRGSKLTQVLKESFIGKSSRTVMVSCVAPNMKNCDHTMNTLRYADRVKERDPQTGKLSASVAANSKIERDQADVDVVKVRLPPRPLTAPAKSFRIDREQDEESSDDENIPPPPSNEELLLQSLEDVTYVEEHEYSENATEKSGYAGHDYKDDSDENDSLEEALRSSDSLQPASPDKMAKHHASSTSTVNPQTLKDNPAAQTLINTHKAVNMELLQMLQHEMTLVNGIDANREDIDDYLKELENMSDHALSLLSTLRESLVNYNASKHNERLENSNPNPLNNSMDYAFDLRD